MEIAEYYTRRYFEDMVRLQIRPADIAPRASGHILEQQELIKELIDKEFAYVAGGNVYFDVAKDPEYGKLSGRKLEDQEASGRVEARSDKRSPQDFALWKFAEKNHVLRWPSPWGNGFPGWHIECSAMAAKYLGQPFDIHGAGLENAFPHNECEIAQSECGTGVKPFARYWMHNNMVTIDGRKMGKSLGNSSYLRDLFQQYDPLTLRFTLLQSHYRSTTEFKPEAISAAGVGYQKLLDTFSKLTAKIEVKQPNTLTTADREHPLVEQFIAEMDDDFNTPKAVAVLFDLARETNLLLADESASSKALESIYRIWSALAGDVLGILPEGIKTSAGSDHTSDLMNLLIDLRKQARIERNFAFSDKLRDELDKIGIMLEDAKGGTSWKVK
jgi:cysteinyl-tRNA synthetase